MLIYSCAFVAFTNICTIASHKFGNYVNIIIGIVYLNETFFVIILLVIFFPLRSEIYLQLKSHCVNQFLILMRTLSRRKTFYFILLQYNKKKNRFQKTIFHTKSLTMIILAFRIKNSGIFIF